MRYHLSNQNNYQTSMLTTQMQCQAVGTWEHNLDATRRTKQRLEKKGPKKTWQKPDSEKAKITDQLLPYKSISRCELCDIEFNHPIIAKAHLTGKPHHKKLKALGLPVPEICVDKSSPDRRENLAQAQSKTVKTETGADQIHDDIVSCVTLGFHFFFKIHDCLRLLAFLACTNQSRHCWQKQTCPCQSNGYHYEEPEICQHLVNKKNWCKTKNQQHKTTLHRHGLSG